MVLLSCPQFFNASKIMVTVEFDHILTIPVACAFAWLDAGEIACPAIRKGNDAI